MRAISLKLHRDQVFLDEDVYVVIGDGVSAPARPAWPGPDSYGPIPKHGIVGSLADVLESLAPELWTAKRRGHDVCLIEQCEQYSPASALSWAADCVEGFAKRVDLLDGNVAEALVLARSYATTRLFQSEQVNTLTAEIDKLLARLGDSGRSAIGKSLLAGAFETEARAEHSYTAGLLDGAVNEYRAEQGQVHEERGIQVALLRAARSLCGADPLVSAREATGYCRKAARLHGGEPEALWQAQELSRYLHPDDEQAQAG